MVVTIDKECINQIKDFNEFEYIYVFKDETLDDLLDIPLHCVHIDYINDLYEVDINLSSYEIKCLKKANIKDNNWRDLPKIHKFKFGIVVPNCNYEEWLEKCIGSIFEQDYSNYEIIFIDDCSTDNSVEKVKKMYEDLLLTDGEFGILKVVQLKQKRLNGGARNEAYLHLSDDVDYVMYIDSDDWLLNNKALSKINRALQRRPDVLFIGMSSHKNGKTEPIYEPKYNDRYDAFVGWSGSCGKVIKKELATRQDCLYPEGTLKEDRNQHRRICINMKNFEVLNEPLYVWNMSNSKSVTTVRSKEILWKTSTIRHYADTLQLYEEQKGKDKRIDKLLEDALNKCKKEIKDGGDRQW